MINSARLRALVDLNIICVGVPLFLRNMTSYQRKNRKSCLSRLRKPSSGRANSFTRVGRELPGPSLDQIRAVHAASMFDASRGATRVRRRAQFSSCSASVNTGGLFVRTSRKALHRSYGKLYSTSRCGMRSHHEIQRSCRERAWAIHRCRGECATAGECVSSLEMWKRKA